MNDQPTNQTDDWREERRDWRDERRTVRNETAPWAGGLILILIGGLLLLRNLNIDLPFLDNWWALFILFPAVGAFSNALTDYRLNNTLTARGRGSLIGGVFLSVLCFSLLFGITSTFFWPVILILGGISLLAGTLIK